ncbi:MAG: hypothetical protein U5L03_01070 [Burkholderiaceae bacterium]|nr:hypothetical protein [Burkholderiaceae bacterium]
MIKIEMHFLPDVYVPCEVCHGQRYNRETLEVRYKGKNIAQVLDLTVEAAAEFFKAVPVLARKLQTLPDVGPRLRPPRPAARPRSRAARRSASSSRPSCPSARHRPHALHPGRAHDRPALRRHCACCSRCCTELGDAGNTVVVIEHNLDVIKTADWVIDLGPEGGDGGGRVVVAGPPEDVAAHDGSHTGRYLGAMLARRRTARAA